MDRQFRIGDEVRLKDNFTGFILLCEKEEALVDFPDIGVFYVPYPFLSHRDDMAKEGKCLENTG